MLILLVFCYLFDFIAVFTFPVQAAAGCRESVFAHVFAQLRLAKRAQSGSDLWWPDPGLIE